MSPPEHLVHVLLESSEHSSEYLMARYPCQKPPDDGLYPYERPRVYYGFSKTSSGSPAWFYSARAARNFAIACHILPVSTPIETIPADQVHPDDLFDDYIQSEKPK